MKNKIAEYWENREKAENIISAFYNSRITKAVIACYSNNDLLNAAKLAETRNCEGVTRKIWDAYLYSS
jgi:hypothetical protein